MHQYQGEELLVGIVCVQLCGEDAPEISCGRAVGGSQNGGERVCTAYVHSNKRRAAVVLLFVLHFGTFSLEESRGVAL